MDFRGLPRSARVYLFFEYCLLSRTVLLCTLTPCDNTATRQIRNATFLYVTANLLIKMLATSAKLRPDPLASCRLARAVGPYGCEGVQIRHYYKAQSLRLRHLMLARERPSCSSSVRVSTSDHLPRVLLFTVCIVGVTART